jgi:hypothetical protein
VHASDTHYHTVPHESNITISKNSPLHIDKRQLAAGTTLHRNSPIA